MIIENESDVTARRAGRARAHARSALPAIMGCRGAAPARLRARSEADRGRVPAGVRASSRELGQLTTASHNEVVLAAGSLGVSALVCLLNNGEHGRRETTANLMGPFWRMDSPRDAERRLDRALADAGRSGVRQRVGARRRRPAGGGRRSGRLAGLGARASTRTRIPRRPT